MPEKKRTEVITRTDTAKTLLLRCKYLVSKMYVQDSRTAVRTDDIKTWWFDYGRLAERLTYTAEVPR